MSITTLKRLCRHLGIQRWPYRQISGINRTIDRLKAELEQSIRRLVPLGDHVEASSTSSAVLDHIKKLIDHRESIIKVCGLSPPHPPSLLRTSMLSLQNRRSKLSVLSFPFVSFQICQSMWSHLSSVSRFSY